MKMSKKWIALLLAIVMVCSLAACAAKTATDEGPKASEPAQSTEPTEAAEQPAEETDDGTLPYEGIKLNVWLCPLKSADEDRAFWIEQYKKFTEQTGAEVDVEIVDWTEVQNKYLTAFMSGNAPDVLYTYNGMAYEFIERGLFEDLTPYYSDEEIADEYFWDANEYKGKHYGVSFAGGTAYRAYCFNMDILNDCGITELPETWDELLDVCDAIATQRPDVYAFMVGLSGNANSMDCSIQNFLLNNGSNFSQGYDTPEMKEACEFMMELFNRGYWSQDALGLDISAVTDLFKEGKVAITCVPGPQNYFSGVEGLNWLASTNVHNEGKDPHCMNIIDTLSMNSATEHKDASIDLIKFMTSADVSVAFNATIYQSTQLRASDAELVVDPAVADVFAHPERGLNSEIAPSGTEMGDVLLSHIQLMVMGTETIEEVQTQLQAAHDEAYSK